MEEILLLPSLKKATLDNYLLHLISKVSVRTRNGLMQISHNLNPDQLYATIYQAGFNFSEIRLVGRTSEEEFECLKGDLSTFISALGIMGEDESKITFIYFSLLNTFKSLPDDTMQHISGMFDEQGRLKLFTLLKYLIDNNTIFEDRERRIFLSIFTSYNYDTPNLSTIAVDYDLTSERVRQIKVEIERNLRTYFSFVSNFPSNILVDYGIQANNPFFVIDNTFSNLINTNEQVSFAHNFYSSILWHQTMNMSLLGGKSQQVADICIENILFKNYYLVKNELIDNFHINPFLIEMDQLKQRKSNAAFSRELRGIINKHLSSTESSLNYS